ncbi:MAG: fused MFS/spermidine synthase [Elusimicrobia bacterium]|nr:fused MFS/spermidine synthase [Elusimicrobiota bacterium]
MRPPTSQPVPASVRHYLLTGVFCTGAVVLCLELVGARVIGPFYGTSLYCWAAVITVTMIALAAGYALGGRAADRDPDPALFAKLTAFAAVAVALVPVLRVPVLKASASLGVRLGALTSSAVLLGPALALLGALGPIVMRATTRDLSRVGTRAGEVMAVSTVGSVLGAVASGFFLIPNLRVPVILHGLAALLLALAGAGFWVIRGKTPWRTAGALAAVLALAWASARPVRDGMLFSRQSPYGEIMVFDVDGLRYLLVDGVTQSVARPRKDAGAAPAAGRTLPPLESDSPYLHTLELAAKLRPGTKRALFIGSGAGQLPLAFEAFHAIPSDVVEIDPVMLEAAAFFGDIAQGLGKTYVEDGRSFLEGGGRTYDIVILDAFVGENPPYQLFTKESFQAARKALSPGGVLAANLVSLVASERDQAWAAVYKTMRSVFPETRAYLASEPYKGLANIVFFCSDRPLAEDLARASLDSRREVREGSSFALEHELTPSPDELGRAVVLTDDFAPVESLLSSTALAWRKVVQDTAGEAVLR